MKKIFLITTLILFALLEIKAQVARVDVAPPLRQNNRTSLNDLLQFHVQSEAETPFLVYLQVAIEQQNNGLVSVLKTNVFELEKGISLAPVLVGYNGSKLQPVSTRIGFENIKRNDFLFPDGKYNYCVELRDREGQVIHKDCASFEQTNPLSFFLVYPFDHQELEENRPVFTWTPLVSPETRNIDYRIRWVESDEKTNASDVFYNSPDFFQVLKVEENLLPYKIEYPEFDPEKYYYWQVETYTGRTILAKSDIWEFHFPEDEIIEKEPVAYVKIDLERFSDLHLFTGDYLSFQWKNDYGAIPFEYKILDFEDKVVCNKSRNDLGMAKTGKNYFKMDVSDLVEVNKIYTLEVSGSKKVYRIKFKKVRL